MKAVRVTLTITGNGVTAEVGAVSFARLAREGFAFHAETGGILKIGAERVPLVIADRSVKEK